MMLHAFWCTRFVVFCLCNTRSVRGAGRGGRDPWRSFLSGRSPPASETTGDRVRARSQSLYRARPLYAPEFNQRVLRNDREPEKRRPAAYNNNLKPANRADVIIEAAARA